MKLQNIEVNNKEFHKSKQETDLNLIDINKIVISDKFNRSDDSCKYLIDYKENGIVRLFCIILPQMSGYIKYFENGEKNMSFMIKDDNALVKYNKI